MTFVFGNMHAVNQIGDEGAEAIGEALAPRQNPDGSWVFNGALNYLVSLWGESVNWLLIRRHVKLSCQVV